MSRNFVVSFHVDEQQLGSTMADLVEKLGKVANLEVNLIQQVPFTKNKPRNSALEKRIKKRAKDYAANVPERYKEGLALMNEISGEQVKKMRGKGKNQRGANGSIMEGAVSMLKHMPPEFHAVAFRMALNKKNIMPANIYSLLDSMGKKGLLKRTSRKGYYLQPSAANGVVGEA